MLERFFKLKESGVTIRTEVIPAFCVVILMSFTYNLGVGMTAGFVLYPFFKLIAGRSIEVHPGLWVLGGYLYFSSYFIHIVEEAAKRVEGVMRYDQVR